MVIFLIALQLSAAPVLATPANEIHYDVSVGDEKGSALLQLGSTGNRRLDIRAHVSRDLQESLGAKKINASFVVLSGNTSEGYLLLHDIRTIHKIDLSGTRSHPKKPDRFIVERVKTNTKASAQTPTGEIEIKITDTQSGDVVHVWHDKKLGKFASIYGLLSSLQPHLAGADDILARQKNGLPRRFMLYKKHGPHIGLDLTRTAVAKIKPEVFDSPPGYSRSAPGAVSPSVLSERLLRRQLGAR